MTAARKKYMFTNIEDIHQFPVEFTLLHAKKSSRDFIEMQLQFIGVFKLTVKNVFYTF